MPRFQVLFDAKACANRLHHEGQRRLHGSVDQVIGQLVRVVEAATDHEPMATVRDTSMHHRQASPVEEVLAFAALARRVAVPIAGTEGLLCDASHVSQQQASACLPSSDFAARDR
jgi:hypothetical protein